MQTEDTKMEKFVLSVITMSNKTLKQDFYWQLNMYALIKVDRCSEKLLLLTIHSFSNSNYHCMFKATEKKMNYYSISQSKPDKVKIYPDGMMQFRNISKIHVI